MASELGPRAPGVEGLVTELRAEQEAGNEAVARALEEAEAAGWPSGWQALAKPRQEARGVKARKVKGSTPTARWRDNARRIVAVRLEELRSFGAAALDPDEVEALHDMRIAAKRLRYVLETHQARARRPAAEGARAATKRCRTCSARSTTAT